MLSKWSCLYTVVLKQTHRSTVHPFIKDQTNTSFRILMYLKYQESLSWQLLIPWYHSFCPCCLDWDFYVFLQSLFLSDKIMNCHYYPNYSNRSPARNYRTRSASVEAYGSIGSLLLPFFLLTLFSSHICFCLSWLFLLLQLL